MRKYVISLQKFVLGVSVFFDVVGGGLALDFLCVLLEGLTASFTLYYIYYGESSLEARIGYLVKIATLCFPLVFVFLVYQASGLLAVLGSISFVLKVLGYTSLKEGVLEIEIVEE